MYNNYSNSNNSRGYIPPSNYSQNTSTYHQPRTTTATTGSANTSDPHFQSPMNTFPDRESINSNKLEFQKSNLRNQFLSNTNPSTDNVRYNRLESERNLAYDDGDDFDFGGTRENPSLLRSNDYELSNLHQRPESPPLPPSPPMNPFTSHQDNTKPFADYQSYPYNEPRNFQNDPFQDAPVSYMPDKAQPPIPEFDEDGVIRSNEKNRIRQLRSKPRFHYTRLPYFGLLVSLIQIIVFIVELAKMAQLTGSAFQTEPYFNPMLGPSTYVLVNMGARYVPCMNAVEDITSDPTIKFPCPNSTDTASNVCNLNELCGLTGVPLVSDEYKPHQWYRVITPIFLHAGFLHIIFNLLLQLSMGFSIERVIGIVKYAIIYMISGISGFLLGANFSPNGVASCGGSGSLFGIVATNLILFLYAGRKNTNMYGTKKYGLFIFIMISEIVVSFVLGLLPGLDNFSHIGGFATGILASILLLQDPFFVYENGIISYQSGLSIWDQFRNNWNPMYNFQDKIASRFYIWCGVRAACLVLLIVYFVLLIHNFFGKSELTEANGCKWCKYISCLPVNGWCDQGTLQVQSTTTNDGNRNSDNNSNASSSAAPASTAPTSIDNNDYKGQKRDLAFEPFEQSFVFDKAFDTFEVPSINQEQVESGQGQGQGSGQGEVDFNVGVAFFVVMGFLTMRFFTRNDRV